MSETTCQTCNQPWANHSMGDVQAHAPKDANGKISQEQFRKILGIISKGK